MLFNSLEFLCFFPMVTTVYFLLPQRYKTSILLLASCGFYMAFVPIYILILAFTIVIDYAAGIWIEDAPKSRQRALLFASLIANLGALAVFKYYAFLSENLSYLGRMLHVSNPLPQLNILLPIGLSFHTFQAMSYTIEVYRGRQRAERDFEIYALYVLFYPQLVAGPIERPQNLLHQFRETHRFEYSRVVDGLKLMALGMFKKVVVADSISEYVDKVYAAPQQKSGPELIVATFFFAFQIYFDFAGYTDIARGAARVMGFSLMKNFDTPYASASISEFWRRWHISLSTWFKDYVYVPLGGSRTSKAKRYRNLATVFLLSGLWHGANWTYIVWGALHAFFLIAGDATKSLRSKFNVPRVVSVATTFILVSFAWIFFRASTLTDALYISTHLGSGIKAGLADLKITNIGFPSVALFAMLAMEWVERKFGLFESIARCGVVERFAFYGALCYASFIVGSLHDEQQFIYFQF